VQVLALVLLIGSTSSNKVLDMQRMLGKWKSRHRRCSVHCTPSWPSSCVAVSTSRRSMTMAKCRCPR